MTDLQVRGAYRSQVTKLAKAAADYLAKPEALPKAENTDHFSSVEEELIVLIRRLKIASENLSQANSKINLAPDIKQDDAQREWEQIIEYEDKASSAIIRLEHRVNKIRAMQGNSVTTSGAVSGTIESHENAVKIPKLQLKKFSGNLDECISFWEQFKSAVHDNQSLSGASKFNYLQSALIGKAAETIRGFTPSESCYTSAIALLEEEFDQHDRIVDKSMQQLMTLQPVTSRNDILGLRKLYNLVTSITRSLTILGVPSTHYFVMLKSVLLKCLPSELRVDFFRTDEEGSSDTEHDSTTLSVGNTTIFKGDNQVKRLLKFLKREVESLEKSNVKTRTTTETRAFKTAAGLFTASKSEKCFFCNENHLSKQCNSSHTIQQRKELLKREGRCYRCTGKGHYSRQCKVRYLKCSKCGKKHATSMCELEENQMTASKTASSVTIERESLSLCSTSLCKLTDVYLQTARAFIMANECSVRLFVRFIIDGGSQRSYIKLNIARKLKLPVIGSQKVKILTFGNTKQTKVQECNVVRFMLKSQYSDICIPLVALEVDEICDDVLIKPSECYYSSFQLADSSTGADELEKGISILIGSDNYWNVVSGEIERITPNLTAIKTIFGWTLQGPAFDPKQITTLSTVVLHSYSDESFNEKRFWDLDVIGITNESDENQIINFHNYVRRHGMRYQAKLLWKDIDIKLDSYKEGAYFRFRNLIRKLSRESDRLFKYEQAMEEFLSCGYAQRVEETSKSGTRLYYLPHRAVYRDDKTTSKVRIVFDASARQGNNASLNNLLSPGPNLLPDVLQILLNFRCGKIGLVSDIKKAFLQIELAHEDKDVHRFFWFEKKNKRYLSSTCSCRIQNESRHFWSNLQPVPTRRYYSNARVKEKRIPRSIFLLGDELQTAEEYWIRFVQQEEYAEEIAALQNKGEVEKSSSILTLNPKVDNSGILRLGSRLREALSQENLYEGLHNPFPIIIPKHSYLAKLLIMDVHNQRAHAGVNFILSELRRKFWIPKVRQLIKSLVRSCVTCLRIRGKPASQPIAPLPLSRISTSRPFQTTGIDFAGPLYVKTAEGSTSKFYCMLFTCSRIRAVHLELTPNLSTESCLMGLRRFIARRGAPDVIISDNAKSFKRASKDVAVLGDVLRSEKLQGYVSNHNILWKFIVERAPWWGGFWERLIRSIKDVLKHTIKRNTLTEEELTTLLVEAEDIVNSRPLTYISEDPLDLAPLTPSHFLKGYFPNSTATENSATGRDLQEKWNFRLRCTKFFWKRWKMEYINLLRSVHHVRRGSTYDIKVGDVVLVHDDLTPRLFWKLAIVENTFPGRDGRVRSCELKIGNGTKLRRPIQLLYPLETRRPEDVENTEKT